MSFLSRLAATTLIMAAFPLAQAAAQGNLLEMGKGALKTIDQNRTGGGEAASRSSSGSSGLGSSLSTGEIGSGLKEALRLGSERVTDKLGQTDGFNADSAVHIPLPKSLQTVQSVLKKTGASGLTDDLELRLNRAAEAATPKAKQIFFNALQAMTLDDARQILNGPNDAATQYFRRTMSPQLKDTMRPIVDRSVADAGAVKALDNVTASAGPLTSLTGNSSPRAMLTDHVLGYAIDGIFHYLAQEEADIRANPAKQTTSLLRKVFSR